MDLQHVINVLDYAVRTSLTHRAPSHPNAAAPCGEWTGVTERVSGPALSADR